MLIAILLTLLTISTCTYSFTCNFTHNKWSRQLRLYLNHIEVVAPTAHSFSLIVDYTDEIVSKTILETGTWQPQLLTLISHIVKTNQKVINLGSHVGLQAILMGKIIGEKGQMSLFEPYSISYKIAVKNMYINGLEGISKIYKLGAGSEKSTMKLWVDKDNTGHSSLIEEQFSQNAYEQIEVDRVDSLISQRVDFALIDVQMFEVNALLGMKSILSKSPTIIILLEWRFLDNPKRDQAKAKELLDWLQGQKYKWFHYYPKEDVCELGTIKQIPHQQLLTIKEEDLLLVGPNANLDMFTSQ